MSHIQMMECVGGETGCPTPQEHRIRVDDWEHGPEAGEARFEALHHVLTVRRQIRWFPDDCDLSIVLWGLVNVGRVAGQQWHTEEVAENLRNCATLLCKALARKLVTINEDQLIQGFEVGRKTERILNG